MPHAPTTSRPDGVTAGRAILTAWLLCGVLDISAACVQSWIQAGRTPGAVLRGVASAIWGSAALKAGAGMAAIGLAMHFTVALTATLVFYALWRRFAVLRTAPLWIVGPLYGVVVFSAMNYGTLPAMTWVRSLYLGTPPRWPGNMSWPQVAIHMIFVGTPIVWGVRRARLRRSGFGEASVVRRLLRAIVAGSVVAWLVLGATPVFAQGMYLKEIEKDGRIYVFNIQANAERFEKTGEMGAAITMPGTGPKGETVIGDNEKALQLYFFRHNLQVVVPDPAPPAAAPSPGRISGLVFGDYYYFAGNHLSTFEDQQGMWIRRAYFTYDHTFSPAVTTRLRFEANSNGRLQGGSATAYIKDAYARWTFYGRQQLTMGIQPSLTFEFVETVWGLRHIEKTPLDLYRTDSSRDTGFTVAGPINSSGSLRYAYQFGNESGSNGETDEFKAQRAIFRFEKNPGFSIEGFWGHFDRALEADRENAQIFVAYRNPKTRLGFTYTFQRREPNNRVGVNTDLDIYSGFGVLDLPRRKVSFYVRVDRFNDPCTDCTQIDYLPIAGNAPFTFTLAGMEYYVLPGFRIGPNIEYVAYSDPASGPKPTNDAVARFTFYWAW